MKMTIQEQRRRNEVVFRIRQLQAKKNQQYGLDEIDGIELIELQTEANKNNWLYW